MVEKAPQRGQGQGRGGRRQGQGGWKYCVCSKCGYTVTHTNGKACLKTKCSKCGGAMVGSNTKGKISTKDMLANVCETCEEIRKKA